MNEWICLGLMAFAVVVDDEWVIPIGCIYLIWEMV